MNQLTDCLCGSRFSIIRKRVWVALDHLVLISTLPVRGCLSELGVLFSLNAWSSGAVVFFFPQTFKPNGELQSQITFKRRPETWTFQIPVPNDHVPVRVGTVARVVGPGEEVRPYFGADAGRCNIGNPTGLWHGADW